MKSIKGEFFYVYKLDLDQEENILHQMKNKAEKKKCDKRSKKGKKVFCCFPPASAVTASWTFLSAR